MPKTKEIMQRHKLYNGNAQAEKLKLKAAWCGAVEDEPSLAVWQTK